MSKIVFFDLETGGLDPARHAVIQIAALAVDAATLDVLDEFERKILFPESAAEPEALAANAYDADVWKREAVAPAGAEEAFSRFCKDHATRECMSKRGSTYYVADGAAHNGAGFDGPFLKAWYGRRDKFMPMWPAVLDTHQLARWTYLHRSDAPENFKLETLAHHLGAWDEGIEFHDALADVKATVEITKRLLGIGTAKT